MASINYTQDSRAQRQALTARLVALSDGRVALHAPAVGLWRGRPPAGALIRPGAPIGHLEVLGVLHELLAPPGAQGLVAAAAQGEEGALARLPVAWGDRLLLLEPHVAADALARADEVASRAPGHGQVLRAPSSGRFYRRPAPDKPAFVAVGDLVHDGQVIGLLEVMKTFTRIHYGGADLPAPARVTALLAEDEADVAVGDPLIAVEPAASA